MTLGEKMQSSRRIVEASPSVNTATATGAGNRIQIRRQVTTGVDTLSSDIPELHEMHLLQSLTNPNPSWKRSKPQSRHASAIRAGELGDVVLLGFPLAAGQPIISSSTHTHTDGSTL